MDSSVLSVLPILSPPDSLLDSLWKMSGYRIFFDPRWVLSLDKCFQRPQWFVLRFHESIMATGVAVHEYGPIGGRLVFPTAPVFIGPDDTLRTEFWNGVKKYAQKRVVASVNILSFDSDPFEIPELFPWRKVVEREEFLWHISDEETHGLNSLSTNHRRNIKKGQKFRLELICGQGDQLLGTHLELCGLSAKRRAMRGSASGSDFSEGARVRRFLESRHGTLWQAVHEGEVVSSILLLGRGPRRYYHSAGTSSTGMSVGASQWLVWNTAVRLREDGVKCFNLAGVSKGQDGLGKFKSGFGAKPVQLQHIYFQRFRSETSMKLSNRLLRAVSMVFRHITHAAY